MTTKIKISDVEVVILNRPAVFLNREIPVKVIYWLSRLQDELAKEYKKYQAMRVELIKGFCKLDENKNPVTVVKKIRTPGGPAETDVVDFPSDDARRQSNQKIQELLDTEIELPFDKIKINLNDLMISNTCPECGEKAKKYCAVNSEDMVLLNPFVDFILDETPEPKHVKKTSQSHNQNPTR
jgi:hypothetical protein